MRKTDKEQRIKELNHSIESMVTSLNDLVIGEITNTMNENPEISKEEIKNIVVSNLKHRTDDNIIFESLASLVDEKQRLLGAKKDKTIDEVIINITPTILSVLSTIFLFTVLIFLFNSEVHQGLRDILNIFIGSALSIVAMSFSYWFGFKDKNINMQRPQDSSIKNSHEERKKS